MFAAALELILALAEVDLVEDFENLAVMNLEVFVDCEQLETIAGSAAEVDPAPEWAGSARYLDASRCSKDRPTIKEAALISESETQ